VAGCKNYLKHRYIYERNKLLLLWKFYFIFMNVEGGRTSGRSEDYWMAGGLADGRRTKDGWRTSGWLED